MRTALRLICIVAWTIAAVETLRIGFYAIQAATDKAAELRGKLGMPSVSLMDALEANDLFARDLPPGVRAMRACYGLAWASLLGTLSLVGLVLEERLPPPAHPPQSRSRRPSLVPPSIFPTPPPVFPPPPAPPP